MSIGAVATVFAGLIIGSVGGNHPEAIGCSVSSEDWLVFHFNVDIVVV